MYNRRSEDVGGGGGGVLPASGSSLPLSTLGNHGRRAATTCPRTTVDRIVTLPTRQSHSALRGTDVATSTPHESCPSRIASKRTRHDKKKKIISVWLTHYRFATHIFCIFFIIIYYCYLLQNHSSRLFFHADIVTDIPFDEAEGTHCRRDFYRKVMDPHPRRLVPLSVAPSLLVVVAVMAGCGRPAAALKCEAGDVSFELLTGYAASPAAKHAMREQLALFTLPQCIDACRSDDQCAAVTYETGVCVSYAAVPQKNANAGELDLRYYTILSLYCCRIVDIIYYMSRCVLITESAGLRDRVARPDTDFSVYL